MAGLWLDYGWTMAGQDYGWAGLWVQEQLTQQLRTLKNDGSEIDHGVEDVQTEVA